MVYSMTLGQDVLALFRDALEHAEFRKLWFGNLVSATGSSVTRLALPLAAALTLGASPLDLGLLTAAGAVPNLLFGLPAGVIVDRLSRRSILIAADSGRALLLCSIPAAALLGVLRMDQLYLVAFGAATLDLLFDTAAVSIVLAVVGRAQLTEGNTLLNLNGQVAKLAGTPLAGFLIAAFSAPIVIALDAVSYVVSALCVAAIGVPGPPTGRADRAGWWAGMREGLAVVWRDPILRSIAGASVLGALAGAVQASVLLLFLARQLALSPATIGGVLAVSGAVAVPSGLLAKVAAERLGAGHAIAAGSGLVALGMLLLPLAQGPPVAVLSVLVLSQALVGLGAPIYSINQLTLRQKAVPDHLQGRTNATRRFLMSGAAPLGALAGGYLGEEAGLRAALFGAALLMALSLVWLVRSPLWAFRDEARPSEAVAAPGQAPP
jgi:MFS family permease